MFRFIFVVFLLWCSVDEVFDPCDASCDCLIDSETFVDTGYHDIVCNTETMDYDTDTYIYDAYPPGPYGFKETLCWHSDKVMLTSDGDTIHNICLPSSEGKVICLNDLGKDKILFVHVIGGDSFSALTGYKINDSSKIIKEKCLFNTTFVSIMISLGEANPTQEDAIKWKERVGSDYPVLYDLNGEWKDKVLNDRWPSAFERDSLPIVFAVNQKDMKIWNTFIGWDFKYNMFGDDWYRSVCDTLSPIAMSYYELTGKQFVY